MARPSFSRLIRRLSRSDRGALLVEFAIVLPLMILMFALIVEGGRMMWSYQTAAAGVRDAARYLGRVVASDLCVTDPAGTSLERYETPLKDIVAQDINKSSVMPSMVTVSDLQISRESCTDGLRVPETAIVRVDATVQIDLPFKAMLEVMGGTFPDVITTTITDRTRVFGA